MIFKMTFFTFIMAFFIFKMISMIHMMISMMTFSPASDNEMKSDNLARSLAMMEDELKRAEERVKIAEERVSYAASVNVRECLAIFEK